MNVALLLGVAVLLLLLLGGVVGIIVAASRRGQGQQPRAQYVPPGAAPPPGGAPLPMPPPPAGGPADARTYELLEELQAIGRAQGYLSLQGKDPRTREIGAELHGMNGKQKMLDAHAVVLTQLGQLRARELEAAWDGIGSWRG